MFLIDKDGEWSPIRQLRISDNLLKMLGNVVALGNDIRQIKWWEVTRPVFVPHVRVENVRLSTGTK